MDDIKRIYLSWGDVDRLINKLLSNLSSYTFDVILAITRGGIIPSAIIAERLRVSQVLVASVDFYEDEEHDLDWPVFMQFPADSFLRGSEVLIVDDIWYRGKQVVNVTERVNLAGGTPYSVVLHYKPNKSRFVDKSPSFFAAETDDWIIYPWELDRGIKGTA